MGSDTSRPPFVGSLAELQTDHGHYIGALLGRALGCRAWACTTRRSRRAPGSRHRDDRVVYPRNPEIDHPRPWTDAPERKLGPHDGRADEPASD